MVPPKPLCLRQSLRGFAAARKSFDHRAASRFFCRKMPLFRGLDALDQTFTLPFGLRPPAGWQATPRGPPPSGGQPAPKLDLTVFTFGSELPAAALWGRASAPTPNRPAWACLNRDRGASAPALAGTPSGGRCRGFLARLPRRQCRPIDPRARMRRAPGLTVYGWRLRPMYLDLDGLGMGPNSCAHVLTDVATSSLGPGG